MKEPRRLRLESSSDLERRLLGAGRARAPREARQRAVVAASAALGTSVAATSGAAAAGTVAKTGSVAAIKWLAVAGVAGIGAMTAAVSIQQGRPVAEATHGGDRGAHVAAVARSTVPVARAPAVPEASASAEAAPSASAPVIEPVPLPTAVRIAAPAASPSSSSGSSLPAEIATLDQARGALAGGDPARALSILDGYTARFPRGSMGAEATVLRIEALMKAGDPAAARRSADAFVAAHPGSAYAERIRSLLGASNP